MLKRSKKAFTPQKSIPMRGDDLLIVMGSGSVGSLFGGLVAATNKEVVLVGRKPHIQEINTKKLRIIGLHQLTVKVQAFDCVESICDFLTKKETFLLFTTKAHQTADAARELKTLLPESIFLVAIQNGLETEKIIKHYFPKNIVLRGVTSIGVCRSGPGVVNYTGKGETFLGFHSQTEKSIAEKLKAIFTDAGLEIKLEPNIEGRVFTKTIVNCALNPLTAIYRVKNKEVLLQKPLRALATKLAQEAWAVAKALKIELTVEDPIAYTFDVIRKTGENTNSMLTDILNKQKTEIDFLNGKIVSLGEKLGVDVSTNLEIYNKIKTLEQSFQN
ncbi:MAG: hypothetical protein DRP02_00650 [Candidatus Gerdarchaeota archaeon]|nr:MAG: hypothetical protein DRP02_00650 [Candidatus Gerdarchaeota archaeon]